MNEAIQAAVEQYIRERDRFWKLATTVEAKCRDILREDATHGYVTSRAKAPDRLEGKLNNLAREGKINDKQIASDILAEVTDLAGVRVIVYTEGDRDPVVERLIRGFSNVDRTGPATFESREHHEANNFYRATHVEAYLPNELISSELDNIRDDVCEIQVCSILAHVWNEIDHDLFYKKLSGEPSETEKRRMFDIGELTVMGDRHIKELLKAKDDRLLAAGLEFEDEFDFVAGLKARFPNTARFSTHATQLFKVCRSIGLARPIDFEPYTSRDMEGDGTWRCKKLGDFLINDNYTSYEPDDTSSDVLLMLVLAARFDEIIGLEDVGRGKGKPTRLGSLARKYKEWDEAGLPGYEED